MGGFAPPESILKMKTYKNLYPQVISFETLYQAYRLARRGKRERQVVADFEFNLESRLLELQSELQTQTYPARWISQLLYL
jgi:RNA-directed DNA polymerase